MAYSDLLTVPPDTITGNPALPDTNACSPSTPPHYPEIPIPNAAQQMAGDICLGLYYERAGRPGRIACGHVVLASGGFCGLFPDGVGYNPGYLLGTYARKGGTLANLELFNRFSLGVDAQLIHQS